MGSYRPIRSEFGLRSGNLSQSGIRKPNKPIRHWCQRTGGDCPRARCWSSKCPLCQTSNSYTRS